MKNLVFKRKSADLSGREIYHIPQSGKTKYNPDDMNYELLAKKVRYFKQDEKGVATMCKIMEDMRNGAAREAAQQAAHKKAKEKAKLISDEEIKEFEAEIMQLV